MLAETTIRSFVAPGQQPRVVPGQFPGLRQLEPSLRGRAGLLGRPLGGQRQRQVSVLRAHHARDPADGDAARTAARVVRPSAGLEVDALGDRGRFREAAPGRGTAPVVDAVLDAAVSSSIRNRSTSRSARAPSIRNVTRQDRRLRLVGGGERLDQVRRCGSVHMLRDDVDAADVQALHDRVEAGSQLVEVGAQPGHRLEVAAHGSQAQLYPLQRHQGVGVAAPSGQPLGLLRDVLEGRRSPSPARNRPG